MLGRADSIPELFCAPAANDNGRRPITMIEPIDPADRDPAQVDAAEFDPARASSRPATSDPFDDDIEGWLVWLADCTVIESSIRRGLDHALGLDALGSGPDGD